jgi:hypothetical protein
MLLVCDRCGWRTPPQDKSWLAGTVQITALGDTAPSFSKDLCADCAKALRVWLERLPAAEVKA